MFPAEKPRLKSFSSPWGFSHNLANNSILEKSCHQQKVYLSLNTDLVVVVVIFSAPINTLCTDECTVRVIYSSCTRLSVPVYVFFPSFLCISTQLIRPYEGPGGGGMSAADEQALSPSKRIF